MLSVALGLTLVLAAIALLARHFAALSAAIVRDSRPARPPPITVRARRPIGPW